MCCNGRVTIAWAIASAGGMGAADEDSDWRASKKKAAGGAFRSDPGTPPGLASSRGGQSGSRRSRDRPPLFSPHIDADDALRRVDEGSLISGRMRVNPRKRDEAYITVAGLETDLIVFGGRMQNRAIDGDVVAVRILPPDQWMDLDRDKADGNDADAADAAEASDDANGVAQIAADLEDVSLGDATPCAADGRWGVLGDLAAKMRRLGRRAAGGVVAVLTPSPCLKEKKHDFK